ncbi:zinc-binding dehydrogenase [Kocuria aegyptia]|uniref:Alcohol dehydrogenase-like C-terminal domain-containing protein n=1 Tax=Kocuria aegyptia TaxID=330943 RepID=A0ABP4WBK7_9MICC
MGIQVLRAITAATVVALDLNEEKRELAKELGAHHDFLLNQEAVEQVKEFTGGPGIHAVFDFVGAQLTIALGQTMIRVGGDHVLVGVGSGTPPAGTLNKPCEPSIRALSGYRSELLGYSRWLSPGDPHADRGRLPRGRREALREVAPRSSAQPRRHCDIKPDTPPTGGRAWTVEAGEA